MTTTGASSKSRKQSGDYAQQNEQYGAVFDTALIADTAGVPVVADDAQARIAAAMEHNRKLFAENPQLQQQYPGIVLFRDLVGVPFLLIGQIVFDVSPWDATAEIANITILRADTGETQDIMVTNKPAVRQLHNFTAKDIRAMLTVIDKENRANPAQPSKLFAYWQPGQTGNDTYPSPF